MPTRPRRPKRTPLTDNRRQRNTWAHKTVAAQVVKDWVAEHGWICPGLAPDHRPHPVAPGELTADHIVPVAAGGTNDRSNYRPLCRSENSRRGARYGRRRG